MFGIFKTSKNYDLSWLEVDMHAHILPGIDDGCADMEKALQCIQGLHQLGLRTLYATPHIYPEVYANTPQTVSVAFTTLSEAIQQDADYAHLNLLAAAEYMVDEQFEQQYNDSTPLTLRQKYILIEMPYLQAANDIGHHVFHLQIKGYQPILAHPERYGYYHNMPHMYSHFKDTGCMLQVNLLSIAGYYGSAVKRTALQLIRKGMVDFIGTDLHHTGHLHAITRFVRQHNLRQLLRHNPIQNQLLA